MSEVEHEDVAAHNAGDGGGNSSWGGSALAVDWATRFPGQLPHYLLMIGSGIHMSTMKNSV
ncbi:hypothetical protein MGG_14844 [Pyricularia oryzae 70-15]|uniref:Uncharacterized protein n=1 Tax=Pyricularia oryzae (strain 70-15 / ATCC MYA-4617 / FGSC 8958) TaxID=242507 RepID=G4N8F2_PYRO7|nr:uncharacterized protein MGG_14844 [Pyricularia oryzae 70-15]EHA51000.1 hypothetical protein MGG_14844 [Pyricularia oryzae 70-15]